MTPRGVSFDSCSLCLFYDLPQGPLMIESAACLTLARDLPKLIRRSVYLSAFKWVFVHHILVQLSLQLALPSFFLPQPHVADVAPPFSVYFDRVSLRIALLAFIRRQLVPTCPPDLRSSGRVLVTQAVSFSAGAPCPCLFSVPSRAPALPFLLGFRLAHLWLLPLHP